MDKDFYYIEKPKGHTEFMLFPKFTNMPQTAYHGDKTFLQELKRKLNNVLNEHYQKENCPVMNFHSSTPKEFRFF